MEEIFYLLNPHWENRSLPTGTIRQKYLDEFLRQISRREIMILLGSRRVGKTTLLYQFIQALMQKTGVPSRSILYLSLDHLGLAQEPIMNLVNHFRAFFNLDRDEKIYVFLDEIQHYENWDQQLKNLYDFENIKFIVSGSSSVLIKKQRDYLTGRYLTTHVYPLDFQEFLYFKGATIGKTETYKYTGFLQEYLEKGGYPEYVLEPHPTYFTNLVDSIIHKDIIKAHNVRNVKVLEQLLLLLTKRMGQRTNYNKLKNVLTVSLDTVREYIGYFQETFLIYEVPKFSYSLNEQIYADRKYYFADTGVRNSLIGKGDLGSLAENVLFLHLQKKYRKVFYGRVNDKEVDFIVQEGENLIPFKSKFEDDISREELNGLLRIMKKYDLKTGFIVTRNLEKVELEKEREIRFVPLWNLLLEG